MTTFRTPRLTPASSLPSWLRGDAYTARHATAVPPGAALAAVGAPVALATAVSAGAPGWSSYRVQPGDTLSGIAARERTSVAVLAGANGIRNVHAIRYGTTLRIPHGKAAAKYAPKPATRRVTVLVKHTVRGGDNVIRIAKRYKVSPRAVAAANRLKAPYVVRLGTTVKVPVVRTVKVGSASRPAAPSRGGTSTARHTVRAGDTLSGLAARYGSSVARLAQLNGLRAPYVLYVGRSVVVGKRTASSSAGSSKARPASARTFAGRTYAESVVAQGDRVRARLRSRPQPSEAQIRSLIVATSRRYGVDPALALAISKQESGWDQAQVSVAGAIGAMQVMPGTGEWMSDVVGRRLDLEKAQDNITAGVALLRWLTARTSNDRDAIAAYYQGLGNVQKYGHFADTKRYVANVVSLRNRYS